MRTLFSKVVIAATSTLILIPAPFAKAVFGPSTTDLLVRMEALSYLENLDKEREEAQALLSAPKTEVINQAELDSLKEKLKEADDAIEEIVRDTQLEIDALKAQKEEESKALTREIELLKVDLQNASTPNLKDDLKEKFWDLVTWKSLTEKEKAERLLKKIAEISEKIGRFTLAVKKLEKDLADPKILHAQAEIKFQSDRHVWEEEKQMTLMALQALHREAEILKKHTPHERGKAKLADTDRKGPCMIKVAECKTIKSWPTFQISQTAACKKDNLDEAKKKATTPKCKTLTYSSSHVEVGECIAEYRATILKGQKGEGSQAQFLGCAR